MSSQTVRVFIEIEKHSNQKYEFNKTENKLELDRVLPYPYFYPYAYGFIENTLAMDGDELDVLIISDTEIKKDRWYDVCMIGVLIMSDEKGLDEKIICVSPQDYKTISNIDLLSDEIKDNIRWFFSNYKSRTPGKWSTVGSFENKEKALELYNKYLISNNKSNCRIV
jgi:inorganic pyrophosphatase